MIEEVLPRGKVLSRPRPRARGTEDVILANPDQAVFIFALWDPEPNLRLLDRLLVVAEHNDLPAIICANKIDLLEPDEDPRELLGLYEDIGYRAIYTSAATGEGVDELRDRLRGKLSVLSGPSGVGKSSLLNAVQPGLGLATRETSPATGKGRHTTVSIRLFPLDAGGFVADTPGLREMGLWEIEPHMLDWLFLEFRPFLGKCRFSSCSHVAEPGCAVIAAVEAGAISIERYDSYCRLREE
jgi:ribosome biogenesis GTPase